MTALRLLAATLAALVLAGGPGAVPASAAPPGPHLEEWWFSGWELQETVWPMTTGEGVTVALLDTGVNASLPELQGVVLPGADFSNRGTDGRVDTDEEVGHGTGMAALIAGQGGPSGWVGVAPGAKILPLVRGSGAGDNARAIRYAADHGADVLNMSFGGGSEGIPNLCPQVVQQAISYAIEKDVVLVASGGNSGSFNNKPEAPASCDGVLAVGALDGDLQPWEDTQRQDYIAVAAPGAEVGTIDDDGRVVHYAAGTSLAAALTSGVVALVRSELPDLSGREVVQRLLSTAKDVGPPGVDQATGYGLILAHSAMTKDVPADAPNPVYDRLDEWREQQGAETPGVAPAAPPGGGDPAEPLLGTTELVLIGVGAALLLVLVVVLVVRSRRRHLTPAGPPLGWSPAGPPPPPQPNPGSWPPPRRE